MLIIQCLYLFEDFLLSLQILNFLFHLKANRDILHLHPQQKLFLDHCILIKYLLRYEYYLHENLLFSHNHFLNEKIKKNIHFHFLHQLYSKLNNFHIYYMLNFQVRKLRQTGIFVTSEKAFTVEIPILNPVNEPRSY